MEEGLSSDSVVLFVLLSEVDLEVEVVVVVSSLVVLVLVLLVVLVLVLLESCIVVICFLTVTEDNVPVEVLDGKDSEEEDILLEEEEEEEFIEANLSIKNQENIDYKINKY